MALLTSIHSLILKGRWANHDHLTNSLKCYESNKLIVLGTSWGQQTRAQLNEFRQTKSNAFVFRHLAKVFVKNHTFHFLSLSLASSSYIVLAKEGTGSRNSCSVIGAAYLFEHIRRVQLM